MAQIFRDENKKFRVTCLMTTADPNIKITGIENKNTCFD